MTDQQKHPSSDDMQNHDKSKRVFVDVDRLSYFEFSQCCPQGFRGISEGIPKRFREYISLSEHEAIVAELKNALEKSPCPIQYGIGHITKSCIKCQTLRKFLNSSSLDN